MDVFCVCTCIVWEWWHLRCDCCDKLTHGSVRDWFQIAGKTWGSHDRSSKPRGIQLTSMTLRVDRWHVNRDDHGYQDRCLAVDLGLCLFPDGEGLCPLLNVSWTLNLNYERNILSIVVINVNVCFILCRKSLCLFIFVGKSLCLFIFRWKYRVIWAVIDRNQPSYNQDNHSIAHKSVFNTALHCTQIGWVIRAVIDRNQPVIITAFHTN